MLCTVSPSGAVGRLSTLPRSVSAFDSKGREAEKLNFALAFEVALFRATGSSNAGVKLTDGLPPPAGFGVIPTTLRARLRPQTSAQ